MGRMTTNDLARVLIEKNGLDKESAQRFLTAVFDTVMYGLQKDKTVKVKGLGTFKVVEVDARESVNVNTGERHLIGSHSKITFTPDIAMKELVNKPFSSFETVILNEGVSFDDMESEEPSQEQLPVAKDLAPVAETVEEEPAPMEDAVEEEPAPVAETVEEEPAPVAEAIEEEPTPVEEAVEEEPAPVAEAVEEEPAPVEESKTEPTPFMTEPTANEEDEVGHTMNPKPKKHQWIWPLALVLCSVASFFLGYHTAYRSASMLYFQNFDTVSVDSTDSMSANDSTARLIVAEAQQSDSLKQDSLNQDSLKQDSLKQDSLRKDSIEKIAQHTASRNPEKQKRDDAEEVDYRKYEQMDARVRTGAYRIVGTAQLLKTGPDETLGRISKRYLGPEMVCYLEVYNGIKASEPLKPGTTIKIPKLELKKKKKTTN